MKLKGKELVVLAKALEDVSGLKGIKFAYAMAKNAKAMGAEVESLQAGLKPSKKYQEYDAKRVEICNEHSAKDDKGKPIMIPIGNGARGYAGLEDNPEFDAAIKVLREEYKDELDARDKLVEDYEAALDEEIEIDIFTVKLSDVPEEITTGQLRAIIDLVVDNEKEK